MNIYTAIMKAADQIERNPHTFDFVQGRRPNREGNCGTPSCALGWVGFFAQSKEQYWTGVCQELFGMDPMDWYDFLSKEAGSFNSWTSSPQECARVLRLYAAKHHAKPVQRTPDWQAMAAIQTVAADVRSQEVAS